MIPSIQTVMRTRYWVRFLCRSAVVLILLWGLWSIRYDVGMIVRTPFDQAGGNPGTPFWIGQAATTMIGFMLVAGVMLAMERFVIRWLAPNPYRGCANCGYPTASRAGPCAECGFKVSE